MQTVSIMDVLDSCLCLVPATALPMPVDPPVREVEGQKVERKKKREK